MGPKRRIAWFVGAIAAAALSLLMPMAPEPRLVLAITAFAMVMWLSETVPLAITALASSFLLVVLAGEPPTTVFAAYFDPVIVLLLGGFFLGAALSRHGLDVALAARLMRRAGPRPALNLLAIMGTTAVFSMWISNTAATAIMLPIALGIVANNPRSPDALARNLVLGVAFSANIGGIATPIGTTANPIALRFLQEAGSPITFFGWMARGVPLAVILVLVLWVVLLRVYPLRDAQLQIPHGVQGFTKSQWGVMGIFVLTVALWLTTDLHGYAASIVAIVPILLLFASRLLREPDIHEIGWPTLLLIGGGLALGAAVSSSGLDGVFAQSITSVVGGGRGWWTFAVVGGAAILMTLFASNTAAAVIMIPIVIQLGTGWQVPLPAITMLAAIALSLDFMVPVGTPPNAMAYGTGHVSVAQMLKVGVWMSGAGFLVATTIAYWFW